MARKRVNNRGFGDNIEIAGFWNRVGSIDGVVVKKVTTKNDDVFFILCLTSPSGDVTNKAGQVVDVAAGQHVAVGRSNATACLEELIGKPGIVYLLSNGEKEFTGKDARGKPQKQTYWDIEVEHDEDASVPSEQMTMRHRDVKASDKLPDEDVPF